MKPSFFRETKTAVHSQQALLAQRSQAYAMEQYVLAGLCVYSQIVIGAALGCASCTVSYPLLTRFAFGSAAYATLYGIINAANSLTTSLAPVVTNVLFDQTGSYNTALLGGLALCVVSLLLLPFLKGVKEPQA